MDDWSTDFFLESWVSLFGHNFKVYCSGSKLEKKISTGGCSTELKNFESKTTKVLNEVEKDFSARKPNQVKVGRFDTYFHSIISTVTASY